MAMNFKTPAFDILSDCSVWHNVEVGRIERQHSQLAHMLGNSAPE